MENGHLGIIRFQTITHFYENKKDGGNWDGPSLSLSSINQTVLLPWQRKARATNGWKLSMGNKTNRKLRGLYPRSTTSRSNCIYCVRQIIHMGAQIKPSFPMLAFLFGFIPKKKSDFSFYITPQVQSVTSRKFTPLLDKYFHAPEIDVEERQRKVEWGAASCGKRAG